MSDSNLGHCSSKSDPGVPVVCNSISLPHDRWDFESSLDLDDAVAIYMDDDFASPFPSQQAHTESDDFWENILGDLVGIEQEESTVEEDSNSMNPDWEQVLPINDSLEESLTEILGFDVDFTQPQLGDRGRSASKKLVENLPLVDLRKEDMVVCAICRDEIEEGEIANKLPCSHFYHRACIVPWLEVKNTCPVCRFELPTND